MNILVPGRNVALAAAMATALTCLMALFGASGHDFLQFYISGGLLLEGESPYDVTARWELQRSILPESNHLLPAVYPPWVYQTCIPLAALPPATARWAWVWIICLAASGCGIVLAENTGQGITAAGTVFLLPTVLGLWIGQPVPVFPLLCGWIWHSLQRNRPALAGVLIGLLLSKPHVGLIVGAPCLLWSLRRGQYAALVSFCITAATLFVIGLSADVAWPFAMAEHIRLYTLPLVLDPRIGVTWFSLLTFVQLDGVWRAVFWLIAAVFAAALTFRVAWDRSRGIHEVLAVSVLAFFFISPYSQFYDYVMLTIPFFALERSSRSRVLLAVYLVVPYLQLMAQVRVVSLDNHQVTFTWMLLLLTLVAVHDMWRSRAARAASQPAVIGS